jgi:hypothetical protein
MTIGRGASSLRSRIPADADAEAALGEVRQPCESASDLGQPLTRTWSFRLEQFSTHIGSPEPANALQAWSTGRPKASSTETVPGEEPPGPNLLVSLWKIASAPIITSSTWRRIRVAIARITRAEFPINPRCQRWARRRSLRSHPVFVRNTAGVFCAEVSARIASSHPGNFSRT